MINEIKQDAESRMGKSVQALRGEIAKIRTGRAHPSFIEHVKVDYYGTETPITQVANVTVEDARTLMVTPWEKTMVQAVEKAIMVSDLGLNPMTAGDVIRIPMPALTEERRKEFVRIVRAETEAGRVAVRNIRRDAIGDIKELLKEKELGEDEARKGEDDIQKITDRFIAEMDEVLAGKEKELMAV